MEELGRLLWSYLGCGGTRQNAVELAGVWRNYRQVVVELAGVWRNYVGRLLCS